MQDHIAGQTRGGGIYIYLFKYYSQDLCKCRHDVEAFAMMYELFMTCHGTIVVGTASYYVESKRKRLGIHVM